MKKIISSAALVAISAMLTLTSVGVEAGPQGCKAQKLKHKLPEERSTIEPGGSFSAQAAHSIQKNTLKFSIKGTTLDINITTKANGTHIVEGTIPAELSGSGFSRIKITGKDKRGCKLSDGWLLKVSGDAPAETKEVPAEAAEDAATETQEAPAEVEASSTDTEAASEE